jgi:DNA-binding CsgD family transcriptional regulator
LYGAHIYKAAFAAARRACEHQDVGLFGWALVELIEAGALTGETKAATDALGLLSERTCASGTDWALGIEARSRALLSDGQAADALYREAVERLARSRIAIHLARGRLLYGEWLRRENRLLEARQQLHAAHEMFSHNGAKAFTERARQELLAAGETVCARAVETVVTLTAQETQIARLARDGHTNDQIGAQLFISPRTVEWHLGKIFTKLNIASRKDLHHALSAAGSPRHHRSSVPTTRSPP